jgi:hypothetical protein
MICCILNTQMISERLEATIETDGSVHGPIDGMTAAKILGILLPGQI